MKVITPDNQVIEDFAILLEITDETLKKIQDNPESINKQEFMLGAIQEKGNNCHIIQITLNHGVNIMFQIHKLLDRYETVSWVNPTGKFSIKRRVLCHQ